MTQKIGLMLHASGHFSTNGRIRIPMGMANAGAFQVPAFVFSLPGKVFRQGLKN